MTDAKDGQIRDAVARLTWGYQSVATCLAGGVPAAAVRAALIELGRDADKELSEAMGERV